MMRMLITIGLWVFPLFIFAQDEYEKTRNSETAMFESDIAPRMIKAETAKAKQKYFFLLRAARQRGMKGHWSTAFVHPE